MMSSAVLAIGGRDFFSFYPTNLKIYYMMIKPVSGKVVKYEMIGFKFNRVTSFFKMPKGQSGSLGCSVKVITSSMET